MARNPPSPDRRRPLDPRVEGAPFPIREMAFYTLQIVIEKERDDEEYAAYSPSLPGCFSRGRTVEEAQRAIRAALSIRLQELISEGKPLPEIRKFLRVEDVTIGLAEHARRGRASKDPPDA